ncbi:UNVERIFIED_ORG: ATP-dependent exoDNAse (exonuclease V) alpha subunit [Pseudomonas vranovensis]|nr:ATP-dependent exoDNAse (exonuclease V) alpha subunit [Pseudomonas vranovensis]
MSRSLDDLLPTPLDARHLAALEPLGKSADLLALLDRWVERGWLRALDRAFVSFLGERDPGGEPLVLLAAALASHQLGHGHVCLDLGETLAEPDFALSLPPEGDALAGPLLLPSQLLERLALDTWLQQLSRSRLVAHGGSDEDSARPLVLNGQRLYLRRYWAYERRIDNALRERLQQVEPTPVDLCARLAQLFDGGAPTGQVDWQKLACALATRSAFSIITGGAGHRQNHHGGAFAGFAASARRRGRPPAAHPPGSADRQGRRAPDRIHRPAGRAPGGGRRGS